MSKLFSENHRLLQRQFDTVRLADRIEQRLYREYLTEEDRAFIERLDMFFLATADGAGRPNCSYKGGDPGFVRVLDQCTLLFPNYDGNGMYISMGNTGENPHVGLLFIDFENQKRLRVNGTAEIAAASAAVPPYAEAQLTVRVLVRQVFPNCPRYIHKMQRIERSNFVPRADVRTPVPGVETHELGLRCASRSGPCPQGCALATAALTGRTARHCARSCDGAVFMPRRAGGRCPPAPAWLQQGLRLIPSS